jgi:hypothetical protein
VKRAWFAAGTLWFFAGCSLGDGEGKVYSEKLVAADCWHGAYDMQPDFFAANPYRNTVQMRIQRGNDIQEVSDGLSVLIDDVEIVRSHYLGKPLSVRLPAGVAPPGTPVGQSPPPAADEPALAHMSLYLERSCHNQNIILQAISGTIVFEQLFSGDPNEKVATEKLTATAQGSNGLAGFDVEMADPRDIPAPGDPIDAVPEDKRTHLRGSFNFYFERGRPGQPFP